MDRFVSGALASFFATVLTNPLEVVKTRLQLQGELKAKGHYKVRYKNFIHAFYIIGSTEGISGLQKGLFPALIHQTFTAGIRLGLFQLAVDNNLNTTDGSISIFKTATIAAICGIIAAFTGNPFLLIKVQMQAQSEHEGMFSKMGKILSERGFLGLWHGFSGSLPRRLIGSLAQLTTFTLLKDLLSTYSIERGFMNSLYSSMIGGIVKTLLSNPFDTISTRLFNQGVDKNGRGLVYSGYFDCVKKLYRAEGISGFYKGVVPLFLKTGPHSILVLMIWEALKNETDTEEL